MTSQAGLQQHSEGVKNAAGEMRHRGCAQVFNQTPPPAPQNEKKKGGSKVSFMVHLHFQLILTKM
jgi:hypothetical protein